MLKSRQALHHSVRAQALGSERLDPDPRPALSGELEYALRPADVDDVRVERVCLLGPFLLLVGIGKAVEDFGAFRLKLSSLPEALDRLAQTPLRIDVSLKDVYKVVYVEEAGEIVVITVMWED